MITTSSPPAGAIDLLTSLGADQVQHHAQRNLLTHLLATYDLLIAWGRPEAVALAGLYHSIYGTSAFDHACVAPHERGRIEAVIGAAAERIAFLFSAMERDAFLDTVGSGILVNRFDGTSISVSSAETSALCDILLANELDLAIAKKGADRPDKIAKKVGPCFALMEAHLSEAGRTAYAEATALETST
jgi:hypothetical protein